MDNSDIKNSHFEFIRSMMENKAVALDFFRHYLPSKLLLAFDFNSLTLIERSGVEGEFCEYFYELVFGCEIAGRPGYLVLLVVCESVKEDMLPYQVYRFVLRLLGEHFEGNPEGLAPVVFPVVWYCGGDLPYPCSLKVEEFFEGSIDLRKKLLEVGAGPDRDR